MFDAEGNFLFHGQDWRNHKYIRKEGNRYIYPEDVKKSNASRAGMPSSIKVDPANSSRAGMPSNIGNKTKKVNNSGKAMAESEKKKGEQFAKSRVNVIKPGRVNAATNGGKTVSKVVRYPETDYGDGTWRSSRTDILFDEKANKGQAYVALREQTKGEKAHKKNEVQREGNKTSKLYKGNRGVADSEKNKGAMNIQRKAKKDSDIVTEYVKKKNDERYEFDVNASKYNPIGATARGIRKAEERAKSYKKENKKIAKRIGADKVISETDGRNATFYKNGKQIKYNGVADTERSKGETAEKNNRNTLGNRLKKSINKAGKTYDEMHEKQANALVKASENIKNAAKKAGNSYNEMHEKQSDALVKATENGRNKVETILENAKKKKEETVKNTLEKAIGGKEVSFESNGQKLTVGYKNGNVTVRDSRGNRINAEYKDGKIVMKDNRGNTVKVDASDLIKKKK